LNASANKEDLTEIKLTPAPELAKNSSSSITINAETANLELVGNFVWKNVVSAGFSEEEANSVELAVDEVVSNAIIHGYQNCPDGKITIETVQIPDGIVVVIEECGRSFNPLAVPEPDFHAPLEHRKIGGLGLFIVKKIADELYFELLPDKTKRFTLIKKIQNPEEI